MKTLISCIALFTSITITITYCSPTPQTQSSANVQDIKAAIDSNRWVFTPQQATPQYGRIRNNLTSDFSLTCKGSTLLVYLPYYGRATAGADVLSGKGPLDFTSTDLDISKQQTQPGQWNITIKPRDNTEVQQMIATFFSNGSASLDVILTNRSGIRYSGVIAPVR